MKYYEASFATILIRFYLMIAVALIAGFANIPWLGVLCLPIFMSAMLGVKFDIGTTNKKANTRNMTSSKSTTRSITEAA